MPSPATSATLTELSETRRKFTLDYTALMAETADLIDSASMHGVLPANESTVKDPLTVQIVVCNI